jgi:chemotaxis regulatin CheY-phosphate phosphatase CheZ
MGSAEPVLSESSVLEELRERLQKLAALTAAIADQVSAIPGTDQRLGHVIALAEVAEEYAARALETTDSL